MPRQPRLDEVKEHRSSRDTRVDVDGIAYTWTEFVRFYNTHFSIEEIRKYWKQCTCELVQELDAKENPEQAAIEEGVTKTTIDGIGDVQIVDTQIDGGGVQAQDCGNNDSKGEHCEQCADVYCEYCYFWLNGPIQLADHKEGKYHVRNEKEYPFDGGRKAKVRATQKKRLIDKSPGGQVHEQIRARIL